ncbi:MAG: hypothetical protein AB7O96_15320 [Pseudobdellovibrionaceae bacterium]
MTWVAVDQTESEAAKKLLKWAKEKAAGDCNLPEDCCGGGDNG